MYEELICAETDLLARNVNFGSVFTLLQLYEFQNETFQHISQ
jgi:hypothetical protein